MYVFDVYEVFIICIAAYCCFFRYKVKLEKVHKKEDSNDIKDKENMWREKLHKAVKAYEKKNSTKLIIIDQFLNDNWLESFTRKLPKDKTLVIDLILNNMCSNRSGIWDTVIKRLKEYKNFRVFVPNLCSGAGTIIALCAPELYLGKTARLNPFSPVVDYERNTEFAYSDYSDVTKSVGTSNESNLKINLACLVGKRIDAYIKDVLPKLINPKYLEKGGYLSNTKTIAEKIMNAFYNTKYMHSVNYDINDCKEIGLDFKDCPEDIMEIYSIEERCDDYINGDGRGFDDIDCNTDAGNDIGKTHDNIQNDAKQIGEIVESALSSPSPVAIIATGTKDLDSKSD